MRLKDTRLLAALHIVSWAGTFRGFSENRGIARLTDKTFFVVFRCVPGLSKLLPLSDQGSNDMARRMKPAKRGTVKSMSPCAGL